MSGDRKLVVFAGGGTGGHLYPSLAVAERLRARLADVRFLFLTSQRGIDRRAVHSVLGTDDAGCDIVGQDVLPFPRTPLQVLRFLRAWRSAVRACTARFKDDPPAAVIGSGGFAAGPPVVCGHRLNLPTALLNPDAVPGKANRYLASRADAIFVQWAGTTEHFRTRHKVHVVGCPVRRAFGSVERKSGIACFGLDPGKRTLLITGASSGARAVNEAMIAAAPTIASRPEWQILHLTGSPDRDRVRDAYSGIGVAAVVIDYTDEMPHALAAADLVLSRAGASTLAEITACGKPAILMPYPHHRDRHQFANAKEAVEAGAAVIVEDRGDSVADGAALSATLARVCDRLEDFARSAADLATTGSRDAAETVAGWIASQSAPLRVDDDASDGSAAGCRDVRTRADDGHVAFVNNHAA